MPDIKNLLEQDDIQTVECLIPDLNGISKGKSVPAHSLLKGEVRLPEAIFGQDVTGGWCEDHDLLDVADNDIVARPDLDTLVVQPWLEGTVQCLCDCEQLDGKPLDVAPRTIL